MAGQVTMKWIVTMDAEMTFINWQAGQVIETGR